MKRYFEKISFNQFKKDISNDEQLYNGYELPKRGTIQSAGYDFRALEDIVVRSKATVLVPTGIKASMYQDEVLFIIIRSSMACKNGLNLSNQTGVIDSDYYNNSKNEGHIFISLYNNGIKDYTLKKGEHFVQGIFSKYLRIENEEMIETARSGGFGSTNKEEKR